MLIAHISDLHYGFFSYRKNVGDILYSEISELKPDLIIVSGDLTTGGLKGQFIKVQQWLDNLAKSVKGVKERDTEQLIKYLLVPGNHDISWFNLYEQLFNPLYSFRSVFPKFIDYTYTIKSNLKNDDTTFENNISIIGINSVRTFTTGRGRITSAHLKWLKDTLSKIPESNFIIVVIHHQLVGLPGAMPMSHYLENTHLLIELLLKSKVDMVLGGHKHSSALLTLNSNWSGREKGHDLILLYSGTSSSNRAIGRENTNSYNLVELSDGIIKITCKIFDKSKSKFIIDSETKFKSFKFCK